jgi:hypothetical protein
MTRIKMIGHAVFAVCAVMAVTAASAMAAENPVLVKPNGEAVNNVSVSGVSVSGSLPTLETTATGAVKLECTKTRQAAAP